MRISEMSTERAFACMARMVPYVAEIVSDPQIAEAKKQVLGLRTGAVTAQAAEPSETGNEHSRAATAGDFMVAVYPLLMETHREAMLGIVAALSGKTLDEVRAQPLSETMAVIRTDFDGELFRFISLCRALGAQRVTWLLHRYRPFTVDALFELARHDAAERRVASYAADMTWLVAGRLTRGRFEIQSPSEIAREAFSAETRVRDTRSGAQIVADLAARLRALP